MSNLQNITYNSSTGITTISSTLSVNGSIYGNNIISTAVGNNVSSISFSGLNITSAGGFYKLIIKVWNNTSTNPKYNLIFNNDTNTNNYRYLYSQNYAGITPTNYGSNTYILTEAGQNSNHLITLNIHPSVNSDRMITNGTCVFETGDVLQAANFQNFTLNHLWLGINNFSTLTFSVSSGTMASVNATLHRGGFL